MTITFDSFAFEGLKLKKYEDYPWGNPKEKQDFYSNLQNESTNYNKEKAIRFSEKEAGEAIHIGLSKSYVFTTLSIFCLVVMALTFSIATFAGTLTLGVLSGLFLLGKFVSRKQAQNSYSNLQMDYNVIEQIF